MIAESYERIHRSNLLMMGILPLQFRDGETPDTLGLSGREEFAIEGIENGEASEVTCAPARRPSAPASARHAARARVPPPRRDPAACSAASRCVRPGIRKGFVGLN